MAYIKKYADFPESIKVGDFEFEFPDPPNKNKIMGYDQSQAKQKFQITSLPRHWSTMSEVEKEIFIDQEWQKRREGIWFYNNGVPTYITGKHYFYINWFRIDVGLPDYRDRDRRWWYAWQFCEDDPNCYGMIYTKNRRDGATYRADSIVLEDVTRKKMSRGGLQAKTGKDATKNFRYLVHAFRKLPPFFQPMFDGTTNPKKELPFREPATRITANNQEITDSGALDSIIDCQTSTEEAYDGEKLYRYFADEWGKMTEASCIETWQIVKECLALGNKIVGKAIIPTTVEEMERKGGANFKYLWDRSSYAAAKAEGKQRTVSGLYRYFVPSYDGLEGYYDEYGNCDTKAARAFLEEERKNLEGDSNALAAYKRKYPFTEEEAFRPDGDNCHFDVEKIVTRLEVLDVSDLTTSGNFVWADGKRDGKVIWQPSKNGKWQISQLPEPGDRNKQSFTRDNVMKPGNNINFTCGVDPYDHDATTDGTKSNAAAYVFRKYNIITDPHQMETDVHKPVCQYINRPSQAKEFYEDMVKMCKFYGCDILVENNKPGIIHFFKDRGYGKYLMNRPEHTHTSNTKSQTTEGAPSSKLLHQIIVEHIESYIFEYSERIDFQELLNDLLNFDITNTTKFDPSMAFGLTLIAANKKLKKEKKVNKHYSYFKKYDNSGTISRRLD